MPVDVGSYSLTVFQTTAEFMFRIICLSF